MTAVILDLLPLQPHRQINKEICIKRTARFGDITIGGKLMLKCNIGIEHVGRT
jgi:hypothetical protein